MTETPDKKGFKFPIGAKLILVIAILLVGCTAIVIFTATHLFSEDSTAFIQYSNSETAGQLAEQAHDYFEYLSNDLQGLAESRNAARFFDKRDDVLAFSTFRRGSPLPTQKHMRASSTLNSPDVEKVLKLSDKNWSGEPTISRTVIGDQTYLVFALPLETNTSKQVTTAGVALVSQSRLLKIFGKEGVVTSYFLDNQGNVLAHPDPTIVSSGVNWSKLEIVKAMLGSSINNGQNRFLGIDNKPYLGAFRQLGIAGAGVVSQVLEERAFEASNQVRYRSGLIAAITLSLAFSLVYFFSMTITKPIRLLVNFTTRISHGDFAIAARSKIKSHDEVGDLATAFDQMAEGLAERERAMNVLSKTQGSDIAAQLMNQDLSQMGGTKKHVTVLFSDLRNFTKFSEGVSPEEVVSMLNEYFEIMVGCVEKYGGRVNKFIGDAIMAMWGAPNSTGNDEWNALRAAIEMRIQLEKLNQLRISRGQDPIKIGVGVHVGEAVAGTIGSKSRLEYTIIGDSVNQASRIEASTKAFGTDLLISHELMEVIKSKFVIEFAGAAEVKGKSEALKMYKVRGYIDDKGQTVTVKTPYSDYTAEAADKVKVAG